MNIKMSISLQLLCGEYVTFEHNGDFHGGFTEGVEAVSGVLSNTIIKYAKDKQICDRCAAESQRLRDANRLA